MVAFVVSGVCDIFDRLSLGVLALLRSLHVELEGTSITVLTTPGAVYVEAMETDL